MPLIVYWILLPAVFLFITAGLGLLVRSAARGLPAELVLPMGTAAAIVGAAYLTYLPATTVLAGPALVLGAVAGWVLAWRSGFSARGFLAEHRAWLLMTAAAFLIFGASVFLSGHPTFTGYTQIVDIGHQFEIADWVAHHGRDYPLAPVSSSESVITKTFNVGYPSGSQAELGALARTFGFEISWAYQPFLALLAASLVPALAHLLRPVIASPWYRAVGALAAGQASILISYAQAGGVKELTAALLLVLAAGVTARSTSDGNGGGLRQVLPLGLAAAAAGAVLSLTLLPWLGILALGALVIGLRHASPRVVALRGALAAGAFAALSIPTVILASQAGGAVSTVRNSADIGNLAEPVGLLASTGVWFTADHRYPLAGSGELWTHTLAVVLLVLAAIGLVVAWRARAEELLLSAVAAAVGLAVVVYVFSAWIELKAMTIAAPITLTLAVAGLSALLSRRRLVPVAWAGLGLLLVAGLVADGMRYRSAVLAPYDRLSELQSIGKRFAGQGPTLYPDFDEQAEYALRDAGGVASVNGSPKFGFAVKPEVAAGRTGLTLQWDLDELELAYLENYRLIVIRRSPGVSRPPANFTLASRGQYFDVWKRTDAPAPSEHVALSGTGQAEDRTACRATLATWRGKGGAVTAAPGTEQFRARFDPAKQSPQLPLTPDGTMMTVNGPGRALGVVTVPRTGRYEVYFTTSAYRPTQLSIDGRSLGRLTDHAYGARPWLVATLSLTRGDHAVAVVRGGGTLAPGSVEAPGGHVLGPVILVAAGQLTPALVRTPAADARCPSTADWLER